MARIVSTHRQRRAMEDLLEKHTARMADGTCVFGAGWNLEKIAQAVSPELGAHHARFVANEMGFRFSRPIPEAKGAVDPEAFADACRRIEAAEEEIASLNERLGTRHARATALLEKISNISTVAKAENAALARRVKALEALFTDAELRCVGGEE